MSSEKPPESTSPGGGLAPGHGRDSVDTGPTLMAMTMPLVVSFVMRAAFTFVDTIYAATIGDEAVAAIGLTVPLEFLMIAIWVGLSTGLTSALSRTMASRQGDKIEQYLSCAWRLAWIVSPAFLLLGVGIWFAAPQWTLSDEVYGMFVVYATVMIIGSACTSFWSVIPDSIVKAHQDTRSMMWAGITSNVINIVLNTVFLFIFHWGIFGIALSTVIGRVGGLAYATARARVHESGRIAAGTHNLPGTDPAPFATILSLAVPAGLTFVLTAVEMAIINVLLANMGDPTESIAAYSIYHRVMLFAYNPIIAMSVAMLPFMGRLVGREDYRGVRAGIRQSLLLSAGYSLVIVGPILWLMGPWLAESLAESPLTAMYARFAIYLVPLACLAGTPSLLLRPVFEAMGMGKPGMIMAALRAAILTVPVSWLGIRIGRSLGYTDIYGLVVGLLVVSIVASTIFGLWLRSALPSHDAPVAPPPDPVIAAT